MSKQEREFSAFDDLTWRQVEGYPEGCYEKILSEDKERGNYTRLLKFEPGAETQDTLYHDYWEEVYILKGGLIDKRKDSTFTQGMYACRPPGMKHGPYVAPVGCVTIEFRYYL